MASGLSLEHLLRSAKADASVAAKAVKAGGAAAGFFMLVLLFSLTGLDKHQAETARNAVYLGLFSVAAAGGLLYAGLKKGFTPVLMSGLTLFAFLELFLFGHPFGCGRMTGKEVYPPDPRLDAIRSEIAASPFRLQGRIFEGPGKGVRLFPHLNMGNVY